MILSVFVQQEGTICDFASSEPWVILTPIEQSIKRKIEAMGTPLKDWDIQIYRGVKLSSSQLKSAMKSSPNANQKMNASGRRNLYDRF